MATPGKSSRQKPPPSKTDRLRQRPNDDGVRASSLEDFRKLQKNRQSKRWHWLAANEGQASSLTSRARLANHPRTRVGGVSSGSPIGNANFAAGTAAATGSRDGS